MTLANFKSNFNWQLRALQQLTDCCGVVPNLPTPTIPCYCYEVSIISGECVVEYTDCAGVFQSTPIGGRDPAVIYVCAQEGTVAAVCLAPLNSASISGGTVDCTATIDCQPPLCFRYATIKSFQGTTPDFSGWTINSLDFNTTYVSVFAADGCTTNVPYTNAGLIFDIHEIIVWYMGDGSSDPVWDIRNDLGDPVSITWNSICQKTCYELVIPSSDSVISLLDIMGPNFINYVNPNTTWGSAFDVSVPASVANAESYYKQCCGTDTTITSTLVGTDYVVQIRDAYVYASPIWTCGSIGSQFFYEIPC